MWKGSTCHVGQMHFLTLANRLPLRGRPSICTDMTAKKTETYAAAMARLEKIVSQIDSNQLDIDQLADSIKEANEIIAFCTAKLTKAEAEVEKLLSDGVETKE